VLARVLRPRKYRNAPCSRHPLRDEADAFAHKLDGEVTHTRKIAAGPCPALHKLHIERIAAEPEHHRLCGLERAECQDRELLRDDDLGIRCEKFARRGFHVVQPGGPEAANCQIAALNPTQLAQPPRRESK
jgi:hypothetical protein